MRAQQPTSPDDIDLASLGQAARKAFPRIALGSLLIGGITAATMATMAPRYTSQATVEIVSRPVANPVNPSSGNTSSDVRESGDKEAIGTHVRKLLSTDLALRLKKDLALATLPEFNAALPADDLFTATLQKLGLAKAKAGETDDDRVLSAYYKAMKVAQLRETRGIMIEFTTSDAQFSARGANTLAETYRDSLTVSRRDETIDARAKLKVEVDRLTGEVSDADNRVTQFRGQRDLFRGGQTATPLKEQQLGEITAELSKVSAAKSEADARSIAAKEQMLRGTAESNPDVQKSQIIPRLTESRIRLERQVSELATTLLPGHPRMRQIQGDLSSLQRQIKDEVKKVVDAMERDAKITADREVSLKKRLAEIKSTITTAAPDDAQLKAHEDMAKAKRTELERVQKAYLSAESTTLTGDAPVEVKIVQRAFPSNEKVWPKPSLFGPLVALACLLVGLAWSITRAIVSGPRGSSGGNSGGDRMRLDPSDLAPSLASAPRLTHAAVTAPIAPATIRSMPTAANQHRAHSVAAALAGLLERDASQGGCRILVAGEATDVDAAAEAVALTKALSTAGKQVVLVDWAQIGTDLADLTGGAKGPGLGQLIEGEASFEDVIQKLADTDAQFVPAGERLADPNVVFDPDRANLVLDALDEAYELIVVYGSHQTARELFEATQGRFDVGVLVAHGAAAAARPEHAFLGFDVPDMTVHRIERGVVTTTRRTPAVRQPETVEARA